MDPLNVPVPSRKMVTKSLCWMDIRFGIAWFAIMGIVSYPAIVLAISILKRIAHA